MNTKEKYVGVFWGAVLIVLGAVFLITQQTSIHIENPWLAMAFTGGLSLAFFASYYFSGVNKWGWLFPACIFAGITLVVLLAQIVPAPEGGWIAAPILLSIAVPFLVAYLLDREKNRWALIPTFAMVAVTLIAGLADFIPGELMGTLVMLLIALPFLYVFLRDRKQKWAAIVAGVLAGISLIPLLSAGLNEEIAGVAVLFLFAAAFFVVFFLNMQRWWALIPGGIFATLGVVTLLSMPNVADTLGGETRAGELAGAVFFLGLGLTFLVLWLRRGAAKVAWAIYPAMVLLALALVTLIAGQTGIDMAWPILLILGGGLLVYLSYRRRMV